MALGAALIALGCGPTFKVETPPGFVELDEHSSPYEYRATSADGLVVAARELPHEPKGELAFWIKAIQNRMRERGGYALLDTKPVKSADGVAGRELRFGHDEGSDSATAKGHPHLYYLTVFVTDSKIYLLEIGGTKEQVTSQAAVIDATIAAFRTGG